MKKSSQRTMRAAAVFGQTMCVYLDVLDMTAPDQVSRVMRTLIPEMMRKEVLESLARQAEVMGSGTLARRLRTIAGDR